MKSIKNNNVTRQICSLFLLASIVSCTNLEEQVLDGTSVSEGGKVDVNGAIVEAQKSFYKVAQGRDRFLTLGEISTDALAAPTRGGDWDDNSKWRQIHTLTWDSDNIFMRQAYNDYMTGIYNTDQVLNNNPNVSQKIDATFYKAYLYYHVIDKWGSVAYREKGAKTTDNPKVHTGAEATNAAIGWLEAILAEAPSKTDTSKVSKDAVNFLLAKFYLNKSVFEAVEKSESYTFKKEDMDKVITHANAVLASSPLTTTAPSGDKFVDDAYWSNFSPNNATLSSEIILSCKNTRGTAFEGNIAYAYRAAMHYNQTPNGSNGWAIPSEFYEKFDANDVRKKYSNADIITNFGNPVGMIQGQVYKPGGTEKVLDRNGNDLNFTVALTLVTQGKAIEIAGVRPMKYIPDWEDLNNPENDGVVYRSSDAMLMIAEALLRGGTGGSMTAQQALDAVRSRVGLSSITADLKNLYDERGRELWFEGWRREDMMRWGTFLNSRQLKPGKSDSKALLYPFPSGALLNPNIKQNAGY